MPGGARHDSNRAIGDRLQLIRLAWSELQGRKRPLGMAEMGRLIGMTSAAWNNAEKGHNRLGLDNAMKLCRKVGVSLDYVYMGDRAGLPHALALEIEKLEASKVRSRG